MKTQYEHRTRQYLPRRTYTLLRLDGKAFHTYTRHAAKPFDARLAADMAETARFLCANIAGAQFAYTQSDEISVLVCDFATIHTEAYLDGNVQKLTSITASMATATFNALRPGRLAFFDSRAFTIPDPVEVVNYFIWRQQDATRNSISMAAQAHFPHGELHGRNTDELQEMLRTQRGVNWNDYPEAFRRGQLIARIAGSLGRGPWEPVETPVFTRSTWLAANIPDLPRLGETAA